MILMAVTLGTPPRGVDYAFEQHIQKSLDKKMVAVTLLLTSFQG